MLDLLINSVVVGIGLSMDAVAVSMADGLSENKMLKRKMLLIALFFGVFQGVMPLIWYFIASIFVAKFVDYIPYISLVILVFLGVRMIIETLKNKDDEEKVNKLTLYAIFIQAIATSIDALSVGFTIADYLVLDALIATSIYAISTFLLSYIAIFIGKKFGMRFEKYAGLFGGVILIAIGLKIFLTAIL